MDKKASGVGKTLGNMEKGFSSLGKNLGEMGKKLSTGVTAPLIAVGAGILKLTTSTADYADEIGLMSEKTGLSIKTVQELRYVTNQLDIDFGVIQNSVTMFTNKLKTANKDSSDVSVTLQRLGLSTEGLKNGTQSISGLYTEVIKKLSGMKNESDRNIMASKLFGRSFSELLPILNAGSGEMERLMQEANDLGLIMSDDSVMSAREFGDSLDSLKEQFGAAFREIAGQFIPIIKDNLIPSIKDNVIPVFKGFANGVKNVIDWFKGLTPETQKVIGIIILLVAAIGPLLMIFGKVASTISGVIGVMKLLISPVGLVIIGVAALAATAYLVVKNWNKVPPFFTSLWTVLKNVFSTGGAAIMVAVRTIQLGLAKFLDFTAGNLLALYSGLFGFMAKIPGIGDAFKDVQNGIDGIRDKLKGFVSSSEKDLNAAKTNIKTAAGETSQAWGTMTKAAGELGKGIGNTVSDAVNGVKNIFKSGSNDIIKTTKETGKEVNTVVAEDANAAAQTAKDALDKQIKNLDSFGSAITKAFRKRYENEEKIETKAIDNSLDRQKTAHDKKLKLYEEEYNAKLRALNAGEESALNSLQSQIDAINNLTDTESKAMEEQEYQKKLADLRKSILQAESNDDKISLQEELDQAIADHERDALLDSRQIQIEQLEQQMENIREQAQNEEDALKDSYDLKKEAADNEYDLKVESMNREKEALQSHYQALADEEALQAEARKLVLGKDQDAIIELLNTYNPGWQDAGLSFGESLINGLNSAKGSVAAAVSGLLSLIPNSSSTSSNSSSTSKSKGAKGIASTGKSEVDAMLEQMKTNSQAWHTATTSEKDKLAAKNIVLAQQVGKITGSKPTIDSSGKWNVLKYASGTNSASPGIHMVGERGPELVEFHGGERVIPNNKLGGTVINLNVKTDNPSDMRQAQKYGEAIVSFLRAKGMNPA